MTQNRSPQKIAEQWVRELDSAVQKQDVQATRALFADDSHWRNLSGLDWALISFSTGDVVARELILRGGEFKASDFAVESFGFAPRQTNLVDDPVIEFAFTFETANGPGSGVARIALPEGDETGQALTISTTLDIDRMVKARQVSKGPESHARNFADPTFNEQRATARAYKNSQPDVLIVGGGHAGISAAVELKRLGLDVLIIDREERIGDNWRLRYDGLKLHNKTPVNHLRYMPFPVVWPDYIPKDKIANWLESYVDGMDLNFWTQTNFETASYDEAAGVWVAEVTSEEHGKRTFRPKHIIMATSVSGTPNIPKIPTLENFENQVLHSSQFSASDDWAGKHVTVFGTGTSSHDISQELEASGAHVTIVQRSPTLVVNVDPAAQLYDKIYLGDGPDINVRDLINASYAFPTVKRLHKRITDEVKVADAEFYKKLEASGFRLDWGINGTGWPLLFRERGGGYYFNVGASELIIDGRIDLIQNANIDAFASDGITMKSGEKRPVDTVILATGYKGPAHNVKLLFGDEVADRVGEIWGIDPETQELRNMWTRTNQPGLWFTGGAFSQCRIYSRFMAMQIEAIEAGRLSKSAEPELESVA